MKTDWSAIRITVLLYIMAVLFPFNYYLAQKSFDSMQNDETTMHNLVLASEIVRSVASTKDLNARDKLKNQMTSSLKTVKKQFIEFTPNREYVTLFSADKHYLSIEKSYNDLETALISNEKINSSLNKVIDDISNFSEVVKEMITYKKEDMLNKLYVSLLVSMISIITLIFFVRYYIKHQLLKHSIHDHVTGLYNRKYFNNMLKKIELLERRQAKPLSLLVLQLSNYENLNQSLNKRAFEAYLKELGEAFGHFFRQSDTVCRIEKDTFASIAPDTTHENIEKLSKRLLKELQYKLNDNTIKVEIKIGVATNSDSYATSLLETAKKNMPKNTVESIGGKK